MLFFSLRSISANVWFLPSGIKTGSYPKPSLPLFSSIMFPLIEPSKRYSLFSKISASLFLQHDRLVLINPASYSGSNNFLSCFYHKKNNRNLRVDNSGNRRNWQRSTLRHNNTQEFGRQRKLSTHMN